MKGNAKVAVRMLGLAVLTVVLYVGGFLIYGTLADWDPEERLPVEASQHTVVRSLEDSVVSLLIWNIGYGGLGRESDFFFDKGNMLVSRGAMVRPDREQVEQNLSQIQSLLRQTKADFFLLQEVDAGSKRSYYQQQVDSLRDEKPAYYAGFAPNYRVDYVPAPLLEPWQAYGPVNSGLLTLSRIEPEESVRLQLPGSYPWPTRIFQLDRCLALHRIDLPGKAGDLVLVNTHLSAYDAGGELKKAQMAFVRELALQEYQAGNYVVFGGDWNQCPPFFRCDGFVPGHPSGEHMMNVEPEFLPREWVWAYDPTLPTNRHVDTPYRPGESFVTLIDYFLLSPNLQLRKARTLDRSFAASDHQPVWVELEFR